MRRPFANVELENEFHTQHQKEVVKQTGQQVQFKDDGTIRAHQCLWAGGGMQSRQVIRMMEAIGHQVIPPIPSLFTFQVNDRLIEGLQGLSIEDVSSHLPWCDIRSHGPLLLTHWGLSGPAILKLSSWAAREIHDREAIPLPHSLDPMGSSALGKLETYAGTHGKNMSAMPSHFDRPGGFGIACSSGARCQQTLPGASWTTHAGSTGGLSDPYGLQGRRKCHKEEFVTCGGIDSGTSNPKPWKAAKPLVVFRGRGFERGCRDGANFQAA